MLESLINHDDYMLLADYRAYVECQRRVSDEVTAATSGESRRRVAVKKDHEFPQHRQP
ncbi:MAG: hypothetical protein DMF89_13355 [Acidobacteria bacterium]|nr:MAG: hypothetical protein DMF89_13355 [Acidobacteriota bacterium]